MTNNHGKDTQKERLNKAADAAQALAAIATIAGEPVTAGSLIILSMALRKAAEKL